MLRRSQDRGGAPGRAGPTAALQPGVRSAELGGTGVPRGVAGDAIPVGARILAVANAFETILDGLGRGDTGVDAAVDHLRLQAGRAFDAQVVRLALQHAAPDAAPRARAEPIRSAAAAGTSARTVATTARLVAA